MRESACEKEKEDASVEFVLIPIARGLVCRVFGPLDSPPDELQHWCSPVELKGGNEEQAGNGRAELLAGELMRRAGTRDDAPW